MSASVVAGLGVLALAAAAALPGPAVAADTTPQKRVVKYVLMPGENSDPIDIPPNIPVSLTGVQLTIGYRGVGQASLLHINKSFIEWVGLESTAGAAITQGFASTAGTHIVYLDYTHEVDVEVAGSDTIVVHNGASATRSGQITLIW